VTMRRLWRWLFSFPGESSITSGAEGSGSSTAPLLAVSRV
jgi:hypothetical protein